MVARSFFVRHVYRFCAFSALMYILISVHLDNFNFVSSGLGCTRSHMWHTRANTCHPLHRFSVLSAGAELKSYRPQVGWLTVSLECAFPL